MNNSGYFLTVFSFVFPFWDWQPVIEDGRLPWRPDSIPLELGLSDTQDMWSCATVCGFAYKDTAERKREKILIRYCENLPWGWDYKSGYSVTLECGASIRNIYTCRVIHDISWSLSCKMTIVNIIFTIELSLIIASYFTKHAKVVASSQWSDDVIDHYGWWLLAVSHVPISFSIHSWHSPPFVFTVWMLQEKLIMSQLSEREKDNPGQGKGTRVVLYAFRRCMKMCAMGFTIEHDLKAKWLKSVSDREITTFPSGTVWRQATRQQTGKIRVYRM